MRLDDYSNPDFDRGRSRLVEVLWIVCAGMLFSTWLPGSGWRRGLLKLFGASIGHGVVIKPRVRVKFPWKLVIGDFSWVGESVWIDNLDRVVIGSNCCISQGAYLCTGSHRWDKERFDLVTKPIQIDEQCWVGAMAHLAPGTHLQEGVVLTMGYQAKGEYRANTVYSNFGSKVRNAR